ncbi:SusD/RagB family nutrient-binding outer membrane lipoprotein [Mucilaginibacter sp. RCC_168]|uniref:SusD/RagB family nutrient-binding outer membrane lipoprotein n=1 Tax=Mucilaginibacter sp. RCC_168 TaxID=3239221 RepID=UPI0035244757
MKKYLSIIFATLALAGSSCKKDYLELSTNPNQPVTTTPNLALSGALKITADITNNVGPGGGSVTSYVNYACWMGYLSWSTSYQPNVALLSYQITSANYNYWTPLYLNVANYNALKASTTNPYFQAIADIMIAFDFQAIVDNYNNAPYTDALKGTAVLNPKYDKGSAIYDDLLKRVDAAMASIQAAQKLAVPPATPGTADIMYKGDMTKWLKFANTLKLRLAIRQSNIASKTVALKAAVAATQSIGYIDATMPGNVNPGYLNSDAFNGQQSPLWRNYGTTQNGGAQGNKNQYQANSYGATVLTSNSDVRGFVVYTTTSGAISATALGITQPPVVAPSKVGTGLLKSATMDAVIMSGSEALFLQAEGVKSGYITSGSAEALYNAGVNASYAELGLTTEQAATYLAANPYPTGEDATDAKQEQAIITEKWKALAIYGAFEAFNEFRRTGYPNNIPLSVYPGANPPNQVTRVPYPAIEYQTNAANAGAEGNISVFTSKIFWAK